LLPVVEARTIASIRPWRLTAASKRGLAVGAGI